jgi:hypothetical protein
LLEGNEEYMLYVRVLVGIQGINKDRVNFFIFVKTKMFRLQGHLLSDKKAIWIALTSVYGIGLSVSKKILDKHGIHLEKKV